MSLNYKMKISRENKGNSAYVKEISGLVLIAKSC